MRALDIGIVGAGTAGAASAILLARAGHRVQVFERVPEPKPIGAGITLQPTGQAALARLGLLAPVKARGAPIETLSVVRRGDRFLFELPYAAVHPRLHGLGIHRGVLFETLFGAARASTATVTCGVEIERSEADAKGRWLIAGGSRLGPFDLVIAADGSVCELHHSAPNVKSTPYPWGAVWVVVDDPGGAFTAQRRLRQVVDGARHMLGFLPTGLPPAHDRPVVSMYWSIRADRVDAWRAAGLPAWRDVVLGMAAEAEPILDAVHAAGGLDSVLFARYRDVAMYPWHGDRVVFLGDAAHATSPQLGQGANLALCDALALADALAGAETVETALVAYSASRRRHLGYYQFATRALTPLFQHDSRLFGWLRDLTFPLFSRLPPLRRRMVRTMLGIDRGFVRSPMSLVELERQMLM